MISRLTAPQVIILISLLRRLLCSSCFGKHHTHLWRPMVRLSTYQKRDSRERVDLTIASISKAYIQMLVLTRAPFQNHQNTRFFTACIAVRFGCRLECYLRIWYRWWILLAVLTDTQSPSGCTRGPPWHFRKPPSWLN